MIAFHAIVAHFLMLSGMLRKTENTEMTQLLFTCARTTMETLEQCVKFAQN